MKEEDLCKFTKLCAQSLKSCKGNPQYLEILPISQLFKYKSLDVSWRCGWRDICPIWHGDLFLKIKEVQLFHTKDEKGEIAAVPIWNSNIGALDFTKQKITSISSTILVKGKEIGQWVLTFYSIPLEFENCIFSCDAQLMKWHCHFES